MRFPSLLFCLLMLPSAARAASPRAQLKELVEQARKTPDDDALREKIIKLAVKLKPAPALPEEAERRMARGTAAFKGARSISDYRDAAKEFEEAVLSAPWSGDAYYNLGVAQDKSEDYAAALRSLRLARLALPNGKEIKDLIYAVEYRNDKKNSPEAKADREAGLQKEKEAARKKSLEGAVFAQTKSFDYGTAEWVISLNYGQGAITYNVISYAGEEWRQRMANSGYHGGKVTMASGPAEGTHFTLVNRESLPMVTPGDSLTCDVSPDGSSCTCAGTLSDNDVWVFQRR